MHQLQDKKTAAGSLFFQRGTRLLGSLSLLLLLQYAGLAQNVGIGTDNPTKRLSVNGTIVVDHDSTNFGTLDSASLLFGKDGKVGISSNKLPFGTNEGGLDFWTNGQKNMVIRQNGNVGIGVTSPLQKLTVDGSIRSYGQILVEDRLYGLGLRVTDDIRIGGAPYDGAYKFQLKNGASYFGGSGLFTGNLTTEGGLTVGWTAEVMNHLKVGSYLQVDGAVHAMDRMGIGGYADNNYRLRVWNGNARIGGDFHATGNAAVGGEVDNNFRLRVYGGDSRFGGNVEVTGNMNASQITTGFINGKGVVKSNGGSSLRIGFDQVNVNLGVVGSYDEQDVTVNISDFSGTNNDVRVFVAQVVPDPLPVQVKR